MLTIKKYIISENVTYYRFPRMIYNSVLSSETHWRTYLLDDSYKYDLRTTISKINGKNTWMKTRNKKVYAFLDDTIN